MYGWFERTQRGVYRLTALGEAALQRWPDATQLLQANGAPANAVPANGTQPNEAPANSSPGSAAGSARVSLATLPQLPP